MTTDDSTAQSNRLLCHVAELNEIDTAIVAAAMAGTAFPSADEIFGALSDALIACSEAIDTYSDKSNPESIRSDLFHLMVAITDLTASLKLYVTLAEQHALPKARSHPR